MIRIYEQITGGTRQLAEQAYHGGGGGEGGAGRVQWCSTVPIGDTLYILYR